MLQLIAGLILLVELPAWLLMIFRPKQDLTRHLIGNYLIFVPLGLLFVFIGVGLVAAQAAMLSQVGAALDGGDAPRRPTHSRQYNPGCLRLASACSRR